MEIPIFPSDRVPQSRENVHIEDVIITPYRDRFRVRVTIQVTPFLERPNLLLVVHDEHDRIVSELNVIETMHHHMEFTLHIRNRSDPTGSYTLTSELFFETRNPPHERRIDTFDIPPEAASS